MCFFLSAIFHAMQPAPPPPPPAAAPEPSSFVVVDFPPLIPPVALPKSIKYPPSHHAAKTQSVRAVGSTSAGQESFTNEYVTSFHESISKVNITT